MGCNAPAASSQIAAPQSARSAVPREITSVAVAALGADARVLSFGELARNGRRQVLVASGAGDASNSAGNSAGTQFTRAALLEQVGTKWVEMLRCDEYLKNPSGYLTGTPREPVTRWRLEFDANSRDHSRDLLFTPLQTSGAAAKPMPTISVRWNPAAGRYQSMDSQNGHFLEEAPTLEIPVAPLR